MLISFSHGSQDSRGEIRLKARSFNIDFSLSIPPRLPSRMYGLALIAVACFIQRWVLRFNLISIWWNWQLAFTCSTTEPLGYLINIRPRMKILRKHAFACLELDHNFLDGRLSAARILSNLHLH